jgi:hypothetical protein
MKKITFTARAVTVLGGAVALWGAMLTGGASAQVPDSQVPADLRAAIKTDVEARGKTFAGMCREITQHEHYGEWCAFVQALDNNSAEVTFGPVASDEIYAQQFTKANGAWTAGNGQEQPQTGTIPAELRAAIKAFVEAQGKVYAGICNEVQQTAKIGEYCAGVELNGPTASVHYGPIFTDDIRTVTFTQEGTSWRAPGSVSPTPAPTTPTPAPTTPTPSTPTPTEPVVTPSPTPEVVAPEPGDGANGIDWTLPGLAGLVVVAGAGAVVAVRQVSRK